MNLLINNETAAELAEFVKKPSNNLLISAPPGSGKTAIAEHVCSNILEVSSRALKSYPYFSHIRSNNDSISIELVRELNGFLSLKPVSSKSISRAVIIEDADLMTKEAQNALLKTLEEPPKDTIIILTSSQPQKLLATVRSRAPLIRVKPVTQRQAVDYFKKLGHSEQDIAKAFKLSGGQVGLLRALLENPDEHPLAVMINKVKEILSADPFERLCKAQGLVNDKAQLATALTAMKKIASAGLEAAAKKGESPLVARWTRLITNILKSQEAAARGVSAKLILTDLLLNA